MQSHGCRSLRWAWGNCSSLFLRMKKYYFDSCNNPLNYSNNYILLYSLIILFLNNTLGNIRRIYSRNYDGNKESLNYLFSVTERHLLCNFMFVITCYMHDLTVAMMFALVTRLIFINCFQKIAITV